MLFMYTRLRRNEIRFDSFLRGHIPLWHLSSKVSRNYSFFVLIIAPIIYIHTFKRERDSFRFLLMWIHLTFIEQSIFLCINYRTDVIYVHTFKRQERMRFVSILTWTHPSLIFIEQSIQKLFFLCINYSTNVIYVHTFKRERDSFRKEGFRGKKIISKRVDIALRKKIDKGDGWGDGKGRRLRGCGCNWSFCRDTAAV